VTRWEDVEAFIVELFGDLDESRKIRLVLKPLKSSASEGVYLVESVREARVAFDTIIGKTDQYGNVNDTVLVQVSPPATSMGPVSCDGVLMCTWRGVVAQEFLSGAEYVVNCVSCDGEHKVVSIWKYDKRPVNGSKFVYFGVNLFESPDGVMETRMASYIRGVLGEWVAQKS
jgi:biotin carboxylase